jgi:hypothetical protein
METVGRTKLAALIVELAKGTTFINVTYTTEPKVRKDCPFRNVRKTTNNTCQLGIDYANKLAKEGEVPAGAEPWFSEVDGQNWLVKHEKTGRVYLRLSPTGNNLPKSVYTADGETITKEELSPYFYKSSGEPPKIFTVPLDTVSHIKMAGKEYRVLDDSRISTTVTTTTTTATI